MTRRRPRAGGYMGLRQVAELLGEEWCVATRFRLTRRFKARERLIGRPLLWRDHDSAGGHWRTTDAAIRDGFPEWFDRRDEMVILLEEALEDHTEQTRVLRNRVNAIAARLAAHVRDHGRAQASAGERCPQDPGGTVTT